MGTFEAPKQGAIVWALKDRVLLVNTVWGFSGILVGTVEYLSKWLAPLPYLVAALGVIATLSLIYVYRLPRSKVFPNGLLHIIRETLGERQLENGDFQYVTTSPGKGAKIFVAILFGVLILIFCGSAYAHAKYEDDGGWLRAWARNLQEDVAAIKTDTREIRSTTARIEEKVAVLKRETSEDPRKELTNLGITWTTSAFKSALANNDERVSGLFFQGGMRFEDPGYTGMGVSVGPLYFLLVKDNPRIVAQFLKYHPPVELLLCKNDLLLLLSPEEGVFNPTPSVSQLNVIKHACGRADVRGIFEGELSEEEKNLEKSRAELGKEKAAKRREPCIDRLMTDGGKALVAATLKMRFKSTETANWSRLLDRIYGLNSNPPSEKILPLVKDYCASEENAVDNSVDDSRVRYLKKLIEALGA